jgi:hypothetical protein
MAGGTASEEGRRNESGEEKRLLRHIGILSIVN